MAPESTRPVPGGPPPSGRRPHRARPSAEPPTRGVFPGGRMLHGSGRGCFFLPERPRGGGGAWRARGRAGAAATAAARSVCCHPRRALPTLGTLLPCALARRRLQRRAAAAGPAEVASRSGQGGVVREPRGGVAEELQRGGVPALGGCGLEPGRNSSGCLGAWLAVQKGGVPALGVGRGLESGDERLR